MMDDGWKCCRVSRNLSDMMAMMMISILKMRMMDNDDDDDDDANYDYDYDDYHHKSWIDILQTSFRSPIDIVIIIVIIYRSPI